MKAKQLILYLILCSAIIKVETIQFPYINKLDQQPGDGKRRLSSQPYISGDTFRGFCNFVIDKTNTILEIDKIKDGDSIFIDGYQELLDFFFQNVLSKIKAHFVLVTHNSDKSDFQEYLQYLDNEKLLAWFGVNMTLDHPKTCAIPIGIANRYWRHGDISVVENARQKPIKKDILLYSNFAIHTNYAKRKPIHDIFSKKAFCIKAENRAFPDFINDLARSKFVVSPPGNGIDCHRAWEALYMGAIPVLETSKLDPIFDGLPVIIVKDWNEITEEFLNKKYDEIMSKSYNLEKIFADYWFKKISSYKENFKSKKELITAYFTASFDDSMKRDYQYNPEAASKDDNWNTLKSLFNEHLLNNPKYSETPKIPKIIHQIWLGNNGKLPEKYWRLQKTWLEKNPGWKYILWTEKEIDAFGLKNRSQYDETKNYGVKADIARYEILYRYGGLYVDTDFECIKSFDILNHLLDFYAGACFGSGASMYNGLVAAAPEHPILLECINNLKPKNRMNESYDEIKYRTGPLYLSKCFFNAIKYHAGPSVVLPITYFYPWPCYFKSNNSPEQVNKWVNPETMANHHWFVSWLK